MGAVQRNLRRDRIAVRRVSVAGIILLLPNILAALAFEFLMSWLDVIAQPQGLISHLLFAAVSSSASALAILLAEVRRWAERRVAEVALWSGALLAIGFDLFVAHSQVPFVPAYSALWLALVEIQTLLVTTLSLARFLGQTPADRKTRRG